MYVNAVTFLKENPEWSNIRNLGIAKVLTKFSASPITASIKPWGFETWDVCWVVLAAP